VFSFGYLVVFTPQPLRRWGMLVLFAMTTPLGGDRVILDEHFLKLQLVTSTKRS
jgi:hypothetical protein